MHAQAFTYCVKALMRIGVEGKHILEIGAMDVNSSEQGMSIRALCEGCAYVGIDERIGLGVDIVVSAIDYDGAGAFDVCISTEALEHTLDPSEIVQCAWRALNPGGVFIVTAAGPERVPHGCDGGAVQPGEHYQNVDPANLRAWLADWDAVTVESNHNAGDVYAVARKPVKK